MSAKELAFRAQTAVRLDELLRRELPAALERDVSNSKIRRLIMAGAVQVAGIQRRVPGFLVRAGSSVTAVIDEEKLFYEKDAGDIAFELTGRDVLYEDDVIILVNKPAFFPTEAGMVASRDNLHDAVVRYLWRASPALRNPPYAGIMHRLDRETSGVILFTKQRPVNAACHDMFEKHTAKKVYEAVCGVKEADMLRLSCELAAGRRFAVDMPMGRISGKSQAAKWGRLPLASGGLASHTDFTVLAVSKKTAAGAIRYVHLRAEPRTGRTHQIRVHLSSSGLPILGDTLYGGLASSRVYLHARSLTFSHPVSGEQMTVTAPYPSDLEKILSAQVY